MDDDDCSSEAPSVDSCEEYINFESIRNPSTQLEEAISFSWPGVYKEDDDGGEGDGDGGEVRKLRKIVLSTLLEEGDLAPLFDGSRWAGTRLWSAAIRAMQFLCGRLPGTEAVLPEHGIASPSGEEGATLLELGCGLGVPGMIYHLLGGNVILSDQADILSQLQANVVANFPLTAKTSFPGDSASDDGGHAIQAAALSWSRVGVRGLLRQIGRSDIGFDLVINCDCVYEPLYGKSWHLLNETIDELLRVNPRCVVMSSMERRCADGIDPFLEEMRNMEHVGSVAKVWCDAGRQIEIYITRGMR